MKTLGLGKILSLRRAAPAAAVVAMCVLYALPGTAASMPYGKNGVVHACYKVKGKNRGAVRVVARSRSCKRLRGWRQISWSAIGSTGVRGESGSTGGERGPAGSSGKDGVPGVPGAPGEVEQSLIETVETQTSQIQELLGNVNGLEESVTSLSGEVNGLEGSLTELTGEVVNLEATVQGACSQLTVLTNQSDELTEAVAGISLSGVVGGLLEIPALPEALGAFECA